MSTFVCDSSCVWCGGCMVLLSRLGLQLMRLRRRMAKLLPPDAKILSRLDAAWPAQSRVPLASVEIAIDDLSNTPYSFRLLKHRLVLPSQWIEQMPDTLRPVLAHELAHLGHRDTSLVLLCRAMLALHWWNPLAWMVRKYVDRAIEWRADEAAATDPQAAVALARVLFDASLPPIVEVSGIDPAHAAFSRCAGDTAERICRLLKPPAATTSAGSGRCRVTALIVAATGIATIAGCAALVPPPVSGELTA
ncbi:MAG: M56 family metallopeptidase [Verrucomicrobiales bacterium]